MAHYSASQPLPCLHAPVYPRRVRAFVRSRTLSATIRLVRIPPASKKYFIVFDVLFLFIVLMFYCIDLAGFAGPVVCVPCLIVPHPAAPCSPVPDISRGM